MNFDIIRKIARILDITDWEKYTFPHDLAITTLKFLTDMKPPVRASRSAKPSVTRSRSKTLKSSSSQKRSHPHILMMKKVGATCNERSINGNFSSPFSEKLHSPYSSGKLQEKVLSEDAPNTSVIVHRISESSYSYTDLKNNEPLTISDGNSDESLSLYDFIHHPTEEQLESIIRKTICTNSWSTTMGDLINKVFHYYPKLNLTYRVDFIKSKALEVIHELQKNTLESCDISL